MKVCYVLTWLLCSKNQCAWSPHNVLFIILWNVNLVVCKRIYSQLSISGLLPNNGHWLMYQLNPLWFMYNRNTWIADTSQFRTTDSSTDCTSSALDLAVNYLLFIKLFFLHIASEVIIYQAFFFLHIVCKVSKNRKPTFWDNHLNHTKKTPSCN